MQTYDLIITGAGAAGLLGAGTAAEKGLNVLLIEKMEKPARKIRISGKGRCNITNTKQHDDFLAHVYPDSRFLNSALRNFSNFKTVEFFNSLGLKTVTERGERIFPESGKAWDVAECLVKWVKKSGAEIICNAKVKSLNIENNKIGSLNVDFGNNEKVIEAKYFMIATGGISYPLTGSTGDGYNFAKQAGHTVTDLQPSLVPLKIKNHNMQLNKLQLKNISLSLYVDNNYIDDEFGEVEFNGTGITGALALRLSRKAVSALMAKKHVELKLDLKPALNYGQLKNRIAREMQTAKTNYALLCKLLPQQIITTFAEKTNIKLQKQITDTDIEKIIKSLKNIVFEISGFNTFDEAIVTAGGVSLKEIDSKTMKSKIVDNLYFAGEVLNLDADTGGYNLQIAFSTARLAAQSIVKQIEGKL
ncbi:MAG: aminoacetone oxidase family FAD-binding enzyme [Prevotellaceae bacterium]|jgi:predicted Rossmann fold flavoprotein|nr:aminoacetone oxidase family FAD-binding enzyme [Prevotellaceae bacterium]